MAYVITPNGVKRGFLRCKICEETLIGAEGIEDAELHVMEEHMIACENPRKFIDFGEVEG